MPDLQLSFTVQHPVSFVLSWLTDMEKFQSIHPVITKIIPLQDNSYKVYETIRFGFLPYSFSYTATVDHVEGSNLVTIRAVVQRMTHIQMAFRLSPVDGHCSVDEDITITSPLPVKPLLRKIFREQHTQLFSNLNKVELPIKA